VSRETDMAGEMLEASFRFGHSEPILARMVRDWATEISKRAGHPSYRLRDPRDEPWMGEGFKMADDSMMRVMGSTWTPQNWSLRMLVTQPGAHRSYTVIDFDSTVLCPILKASVVDMLPL
jgi:hypothetical protein